MIVRVLVSYRTVLNVRVVVADGLPVVQYSYAASEQ